MHCECPHRKEVGQSTDAEKAPVTPVKVSYKELDSSSRLLDLEGIPSQSSGHAQVWSLFLPIIAIVATWSFESQNCMLVNVHHLNNKITKVG